MNVTTQSPADYPCIYTQNVCVYAWLVTHIEVEAEVVE